jgi:outer membrane protein TolC
MTSQPCFLRLASRATAWSVSVALILLPALAAAEGLGVDDAIRAAWRNNAGLAASAEQVEAARADADAARDARLPTLAFTARGVATDEPVGAFGLRLDEQRITQADFAPARLNAPDFIGGVGLGATVALPIYAGGRLSAGRRAATAQAEAEASAHERERQQVALAVVQAYFSAQVAAQGVRYAEDQLEHTRETERFVQARNKQGLALDADVARATAFRAQAEAARATAIQALASARSGLALLAGDEAGRAELSTPFDTAGLAAPGPATPSDMGERPDLRAARSRVDAAQDAATAARGNLLPQLSAQASVETMRSAIDQGATWTTLALVARWQLGLGDVRTAKAARARARAAASAREWQERQARREVEEARRAVETADVRVASAREAVSASESARALRLARHRQGLLPLTDVLDAEAGLAGARALMLQSRLEARVARAQLELALGQPVEGVKS